MAGLKEMTEKFHVFEFFRRRSSGFKAGEERRKEERFGAGDGNTIPGSFVTSLVLRCCNIALLGSFSIAFSQGSLADPKPLWFEYRSSDAWLHLYDPTLISDRFEFELSFEEDEQSRSSLQLDSSIRMAIPVRKDLAFGYQLGLPVKSVDSDASDVEGLGDLNLKVGYIGRFSPTLRWGLAIRGQFDTATAPELGDDVLQLRQISALRWNATDSVVLGFNLEYNFTPGNERGSDISALEVKFPVTYRVSDGLAASLEYRPKWNFENGTDRHRLSLNGSHLFGNEKQYAFTLGGEVPLTAEAFDWKVLTRLSWFF